LAVQPGASSNAMEAHRNLIPGDFEYASVFKVVSPTNGAT
jgi:hypothetical protein